MGEGDHQEEDVRQLAEGEEAPLVVGAGVGCEEVAEDPDPAEGDVVEDCGPGDAGEDTQGQDDGGEGDHPVYVLGEEDLAGGAVAGDVQRGRDQRPGKVGRHGVVGHEACETGDDEDVVEETLACAGAEGQGEEDELVEVC